MGKLNNIPESSEPRLVRSSRFLLLCITLFPLLVLLLILLLTVVILLELLPLPLGVRSGGTQDDIDGAAKPVKFAEEDGIDLGKNAFRCDVVVVLLLPLLFVVNILERAQNILLLLLPTQIILETVFNSSVAIIIIM